MAGEAICNCPEDEHGLRSGTQSANIEGVREEISKASKLAEPGRQIHFGPRRQ
jgi:hypothetical protein